MALKINTLLGNRKDSSRCFAIGDYITVIFVVSLMAVPFINIYQISNDYTINVVEWDGYFGQVNYLGNVSSNDVEFVVEEQLVGVGEESFYFPLRAERDIYVDTSHGDYKWCSNYNFTEQQIDVFEVYMTSPPIQIYETMYDDDRNLKETVFPVNWTSVWDNFAVYYYLVNDNNEGIAYEFTNSASESANDFENKELITPFGNFSVDVFRLNISGEYVYSNVSGIETYYVSLECKPFTPLDDSKYFDTGLNNVGLTYSVISEIASSNEKVKQTNLLQSIRQLYGYFSPSEYDSEFKASQFGLFIEVNAVIDIDIYFNPYFMDIYNVYERSSHRYMNNAFSFHEYPVFIGRVQPIDNVIMGVLITDLIIIGTGILIIVLAYNIPTKQLKEQKIKEKNKCFLD